MSNLRKFLVGMGLSDAEITAAGQTGQTGTQPDFEVGRATREAPWIKDAVDWLKEHGWNGGQHGLLPGVLPKCYLLLLCKSNTLPMTHACPKKDLKVLSNMKSGITNDARSSPIVLGAAVVQSSGIGVISPSEGTLALKATVRSICFLLH